jgi:hypothetical protein
MSNGNKHVQHSKCSKLIISYLPAFSFVLAYLIFQYLIPDVSIIVSPSQTLRSLFFFCLFLVVIGFISYRIFRNHEKAGLVLWVIAELFLFSQPFFIFSIVISVVSILIWTGLTKIRKKPLSLSYISFILSTLGFGLSIIVLVLDRIPINLYIRGIPEIAEPPKTGLVISEVPPDIYYIVLDAYARSDVLKELFDFDNSELTDYLTEKGFIIPTNNHSNYGASEPSEATTLNIQYVQTLMPDAEGWPHWWLLTSLIENNAVKTMLGEVGYKSISIDVDYEVINDKKVDIYFQSLPIRLNAYEKYLIQTSPLSILSPIIEKFASLNTYSSHRKIVNFAFLTLSEIPELDSPKFIYSHITSPHPPFVFDKYGQPVEPSYEFSFYDGIDFPGSKEQYMMEYVDQLQYINQQLIMAIDSILEQSEIPPVIVIMGDHGSRLYSDFAEPANSCISEGFSNFMALYLPGMDPAEVPSNITSVNVFRLIFDYYFGTEFGMLENRYYFFSDEVIAYRFKDVGQSIDLDCEVVP